MLGESSRGEDFARRLSSGHVVLDAEPRAQRCAGDLDRRLRAIGFSDEHARQRVDAITDATSQPNPRQQSLGCDVAPAGIDSIEGGVNVGERLPGRYERCLRFHVSILSPTEEKIEQEYESVDN